ncbi:MAG: magnesium/cobalt transporter CorA [Siphonobacter sp.]
MSSHKRNFKHTSLGTSPGTLRYVGPNLESRVTITKTEYNKSFQQSNTITDLNKVEPNPDPGIITWINIDGIHQEEVVSEIGKHYDLHPLLLEDILNTLQKPKLEYYNDSVVFLVAKWPEYDSKCHEVVLEQVALVLGKNWVLSFQEERKRDIFSPILKRIQERVGNTRSSRADYLYYSIIDLVVDQYFSVIEELGDHLDDLEAELFKNLSKPRDIGSFYTIQRQLSTIRKAVIPLNEIINTIGKETSDTHTKLISPKMEPYFRDLHDHIHQVYETTEMYREQITQLMELYTSALDNRLNATMKVLTVISVIFMPLSFIAAVYGMNFEFMPELHWQYGYPFALSMMAIIVVIMLFWFRKKKWL